MYAHVTGGVVDQVGRPPRLAYDGSRWWDLRSLDPSALAACSWWPAAETPRPADTQTTTWDSTWTLGGAQAVQVWTERQWTADELAAQAAQAERDATRTAVRAVVDDLRAEKARAQAVIDGVTALATPNATQQWVRENARAVKRTADAAIELAKFARDIA